MYRDTGKSSVLPEIPLRAYLVTSVPTTYVPILYIVGILSIPLMLRCLNFDIFFEDEHWSLIGHVE